MRPPPLPGARHRSWIFWSLIAANFLFALLAVVVALWLVMPVWFRLAVVDRAPWLSLAYRAAESDGGGGGWMVQLHERFSRQAVLQIAVRRLDHGTPDEQEYAARHVGWIFWKRSREPEFQLTDAQLKQRLIAALVAVSHGPHPPSTDAACYALLRMGESARLPEILEILDRQPMKRWHSTFLFDDIKDPLLTTYLLKWFNTQPDEPTLKALMAQDDPRAEALLISLLRSTADARSWGRTIMQESRSSPMYLAAVRDLCANAGANNDLRRAAIYTLAAADQGLDLVLDVRIDPQTAVTHQVAEEFLERNTDQLSAEHVYRWQTAPPLPREMIR